MYIHGIYVCYIPGIYVCYIPGIYVCYIRGIYVCYIPGIYVCYIRGIYVRIHIYTYVTYVCIHICIAISSGSPMLSLELETLIRTWSSRVSLAHTPTV